MSNDILNKLTSTSRKGRLMLGVAVVTIITLPFMMGINDAGNRTVVQYPSGKVFVKFTPGPYFQMFGKVTEYRDVITFDFDKTDAKGEASLDNDGIAVRYQDGGTGTIYGKARFNLPDDQETMILAHKDFRTNQGISYKLIKTVTEEAQNLTAGLMTSEEAYTEKRGTFTEWSRDQLSAGKYLTETKEITTSDEAGNEVLKNIPVISYGEDGFPKRFESDLKTYGVTISGYQITDWDFEEKTLNQIAAKREATMAIITSKAEAERAKQDAITAEQTGKRNVTVAKYEKEVEKERAVVEAQQAKEVAVIKAGQQVAVAEQGKLEAEQKKFAAVEYKEEQTLRGEGDAAYKRLVIQADGALSEKIEAYKYGVDKYADAIGKQKWVPEIQMGGSADGNTASTLTSVFEAKMLQDLGLDLSIKKK